MVVNNNNNRKYINLSNEAMSNINNLSSLNNNNEFNPKLCEVVDTFFAMKQYCQRELFGIFTHSEIELLCNVFKFKSYTPNINSKTFFKDAINEKIMFENILNEFRVDEEPFIEKIEKLTSFQCYFLMQLICDFFVKSEEAIEEQNETLFSNFFGFLIKKENSSFHQDIKEV